MNILKLKGRIAERGLTQRELAKKMGIAESTLTSKLQRKVFTNRDIEVIIEALQIDDPWEYFFCSSNSVRS